ncbi:hypothetical protein GCM10009850_121830 [Nonomuraea monospora]|uniref:4-oxalocrotonate tautomerase-like domain-containing protein n=1 Tax=Nonomuraea monospora TaxID=568818 RepID=A0ABP5Q2X5_9ACTN
MPLIQVTVAQGRRPEQLHALGVALTDAAQDTLNAPRDTIRVIITEVSPDHWFTGGQSLAARRAGAAGELQP